MTRVRIKITGDACRSCGACCFSASGGEVLAYGYADLTPDDVARLAPATRRKLVEMFVGGEVRHATAARALPTGGAACQFLRGTPGKRCSCAIYARRPQICADFRVDSVPCREAREDLVARS